MSRSVLVLRPRAGCIEPRSAGRRTVPGRAIDRAIDRADRDDLMMIR
jgi:hypothetical protein